LKLTADHIRVSAPSGYVILNEIDGSEIKRVSGLNGLFKAKTFLREKDEEGETSFMTTGKGVMYAHNEVGGFFIVSEEVYKPEDWS